VENRLSSEWLNQAVNYFVWSWGRRGRETVLQVRVVVVVVVAWA
jgi:hypothetical protein